MPNELKELKELLINPIRQKVLANALENWIQVNEDYYRDAKTEDEAADMATQIGESQELYRELTGKEWKE